MKFRLPEAKAINIDLYIYSAVVSVVAKILEKIVATKLSTYLTVHTFYTHIREHISTVSLHTDGGCRCYNHSVGQR